jgi:hypothetical protein
LVSEAAAITAWNQRSTPAGVAALKREVERLRGALEAIERADREHPGGTTAAHASPFATGTFADTARAALAHKEPGDEG